MSRRYGVLPSELIKNGNNVDILIADIGQNWENWQQEKQNAKQKGLPPPAPRLSEAEMLQMVERVNRMKKDK